NFINHVIHGPFESVPIDGLLRFDIDEPVPLPKLQEPKITRQTARDLGLPSDPTPTLPGSAVEQRSSPQTPETPQTARPRRLDQLAGQGAAFSPEKPATKASADRANVIRRHRFSKTIPSDMIQKLMTAVVVVRALV